MAEAVFQPVAGERSSQAPTDPHPVDHLGKCLESLAAGVFQPGQFIEHNRVEVEILFAQPLQVVVVGDDDVGFRLQRIRSFARCADRNPQTQFRRPLPYLDRPDADADPLWGQHQESFGDPVVDRIAHGGQRQRRLSCAYRREDHGAIMLVQKVRAFFLVVAQLHFSH